MCAYVHMHLCMHMSIYTYTSSEARAATLAGADGGVAADGVPGDAPSWHAEQKLQGLELGLDPIYRKASRLRLQGAITD